jgi:hypothetical protein
MPHKQIAEYLYEKHGLSGWWSQVVTVVYEQEQDCVKNIRNLMTLVFLVESFLATL